MASKPTAKVENSPLPSFKNTDHVEYELKPAKQYIDEEFYQKIRHTEVLYGQKEEQHIHDETSVFTLTDDQITELVCGTHHVHGPDVPFDEDSFFVVVKNILQRATQNIEKIVLGRTNVPGAKIEEVQNLDNSTSPVRELKSVGCELSCNKSPGEKIAHETTISVLRKLSNYKWEAKAVLALAALTHEFGEFWQYAHLLQLLPSDPLVKQFAYLKNVPQLIRTLKLEKHQHDVEDLSNLIKKTIQVIAIFDKFEKLSERHGLENVPTLSEVFRIMPAHVYWTISSIAALATKISILITEEPREDTHHDLAPYAEKITTILRRLENLLSICERERDEFVAFNELDKIFKIPGEIQERLKILIFTKKNFNRQALIDGSTNQPVDIDKLNGKTLFLFISTLDITVKDDTELLKQVHQRAKDEDGKYAIVWIPIVTEWSVELQQSFGKLRSEIPWYSLQHFQRIPGIRYIEKKWDFKGKSKVVVINPQGLEENINTFHLIETWRLTIFPYTRESIKDNFDEKNWLISLFHGINVEFTETWIKNEKYIFIYGGKHDVIINFDEKVTALKDDTAFKNTLKIDIEQFWVGGTAREGKESGDAAQFLNLIKSLFSIKLADKPDDPLTKHLKTLLSAENSSTWAVLSKGSKLVATGHGPAILKVVEDPEKLKKLAKTKKDFGAAFIELYSEEVSQLKKLPCNHFDVPVTAGKVPETIQCSECHRIMETHITYKCCHGRKNNDDPGVYAH